MSKVQEGAMQGLIDALDPYSSYLTKEQIGALDSQKGNTAEVRSGAVQAVEYPLRRCDHSERPC